jgi:hypothetical protein
MARFRVECGTCKKASVVHAERWTLADKKCKYEECAGTLHRVGTGPSVQVREKLDNGAMSRAVDRLAASERLHEERARGADERAGRAAGT